MNTPKEVYILFCTKKIHNQEVFEIFDVVDNQDKANTRLYDLQQYTNVLHADWVRKVIK